MTAPIYFDAETWLAQFESVGGGWIVRDFLTLIIQIEGRPMRDQQVASDMIARLTQDEQRILIAHLACRTPLEVRDA